MRIRSDFSAPGDDREELADRVSARSLTRRTCQQARTALAIVALVAAFLIAGL